MKLLLILVFTLSISFGSSGEKSIHPVPSKEARDVYKTALNQATAAANISVPNGFTIEVVRSAGENDGSWIAIEFDSHNRLFVSREDQGILRFKLDGHGQLIEKRTVSSDLKQCRGLLWAYNSLYVHSNGQEAENSGLFRLRDVNQDGRFEAVDQLMVGAPLTSIDRGRNQLRLGPDGNIYIMFGSGVEISHQINKGHSFLRNYEEDELIANPWDVDGFSVHGAAPGGHIVRMDKDGQRFQLVAGGFSNAMDVVFNRDHEMFTFDGDDEWDSALPWYRPSRILHVVGGADFGWRKGTSKWSDYYEDSLPSLVDIGLAVPTGMEFGYQSGFPKNWQNRLFVGDWAYGRIIAVDVESSGGSYKSSGYQTFVYGRPLNIVDMKFGPDGHLYFVTGGRETKSAIYRVKWEGEHSDIVGGGSGSVVNDHLLRRKLEYFHLLNGKSDRQSWPPELRSKTEKEKQLYLKNAVRLALDNIDHEDRFVRHAARLVLENQSPELWLAKALKSEAPAAYIAIARGGYLGEGALVKRMNKIDLSKLAEDRLLAMLRAYQINFIRDGLPSKELKKSLSVQLLGMFPTSSDRVNFELFELLVYLDAPGLLDKVSQVLSDVETTEGLAHYLVNARYMNIVWNLETRRHYLQSVQRLEVFPGGDKHQEVIDRLRADIADKMSQPELLALSKWMKPKQLEVSNEEQGDGDLSREEKLVWAVDDFSLYYDHGLAGRNFEVGKQLYSNADCAQCHDNKLLSAAERGPSLYDMRKLGLYELMVALVHPSRVIKDKYRNPAIPNLSAMPSGLIDGLEKEQVLELLAYLKSGGDDTHTVYHGLAVDVERLVESRLPKISEVRVRGKAGIVKYGEVDLPQPKRRKQLSPSLFKKNSAANNDRQRLFNEMNAIISDFPSATFEFVGHADDTQWDQTNYDISFNRARFTVDYLSYLGMPRDKMTFRGVGAKEPDEVGNRRVEIFVSY